MLGGLKISFKEVEIGNFSNNYDEYLLNVEISHHQSIIYIYIYI